MRIRKCGSGCMTVGKTDANVLAEKINLIKEEQNDRAKKEYQHTIAKEVSYSGIGLHSGKDVLMTLKPAEADTGIVFVRTDLPGRPEIKALPENVSSTVKATTLSANGAEVLRLSILWVRCL